MGLKELYYRLEDGYYAVLDKIQRVIPIYSIIDPIDKVFPSFVLVMVLILALIAGGAFFLVNQKPAVFDAYLKVLDSENNPVANATVSIQLEDQTIDASTKENGIVKVPLKGPLGIGIVSVFADGFEQIQNESVNFKADETSKILLESVASFAPLQYNITLRNSQTGNVVTDATVIASFRCSGTPNSHPPNINIPHGQFIVETQTSCGTLTADFTPIALYQERNGVPIVSDGDIELEPLETTPQVGGILVTLTDSNNQKVVGADLSYWLSVEPNNQKSGGQTDAMGKRLIEDLAVGAYKVAAFASDGRTVQTPTAVQVTADQITNVSLQLPPLQNGKKIFLKVIDRDTNQPLNNVDVHLYDETLLLPTSGSTNQNGIFEKNVDQTSTSSFSAVLFNPGFLILVREGLPAYEVGETKPLEVVMDKANENAQGMPLNYANAVVRTVSESNVPIPNAQVQLYRSNYPNPLVSTSVSSDGNLLIKHLYPNSSNNTYQFKAQKQSLDASGESNHQQLAAGETKEFVVTLFVATGDFEITALRNDNSSQKIAQASVLAKALGEDGTYTQFATCITDSTGKCTIQDVKTNKKVRFEVRAPNYLPFFSDEYFATKDQVLKIDARLVYSASVPGSPCQAPSDCPIPMVCNGEHVCEQTCTSTTECPTGFYCSSNQLCESAPLNYCEDNADCTAPQTCNLNFNQCQEPVGQTCQTNAECGNIVCDPTTQTCQDPTGEFCTTDTDCGGNDFICSNQACVKTCNAPNDCQAGFVCNASSNRCEATGPTNQIEVSYVKLLDASKNPLPSSHLMQSNKEYWAFFDLVLRTPMDWNNVLLHFRTGLDQYPQASDNNSWVKALNPVSGLSNVTTAFYSFTALDDVFSLSDEYLVDPLVVSAKHVNRKYPGLPAGAYEISVKFQTKNALKVGTPIELHFQAKGTNSGVTYATPHHQKNFEIGGSLCTTNCPVFAWQFFLNNPQGNALNLGQATHITENDAFSLYYLLRNQSQTGFSNAQVSASTSDSVLLVNPYSNSQALPAQSTTTMGLVNPVLFSTGSVLSSGQTGAVEFNVDTLPQVSESGTDSSFQSVLFSVQTGETIKLEVRKFANNQFTVIATENAPGNPPVANALIRIKFNYCNETNLATVPITDWDIASPDDVSGADGRFSDPTLTPENVGECMLVEAQKSGFATKRIIAHVGETTTFGEPLDCISLDLNPGNPSVQALRELDRGQTAGIELRSSCLVPYDIKVYTFEKIEDALELNGLGDRQTTLVLNPDGVISADATITPQSPMGYLPLVLEVSQNTDVLSVAILGEFIIKDPNKKFNITDDTP